MWAIYTLYWTDKYCSCPTSFFRNTLVHWIPHCLPCSSFAGGRCGWSKPCVLALMAKISRLMPGNIWLGQRTTAQACMHAVVVPCSVVSVRLVLCFVSAVVRRGRSRPPSAVGPLVMMLSEGVWNGVGCRVLVAGGC